MPGLSLEEREAVLSAIAGLITLEPSGPIMGGPVDAHRACADMLHALRHRARRAGRISVSERAAIGQAGGPTDSSPTAWFGASGGRPRRYLAACDSRIDNRADILRALGDLPGTSCMPDDELLVAAFERWGTRFAERVIGDFAVAIWNEEDQQLVCARDRMGVKPFYYFHKPGEFFAFASEIKALLGLPHVPRLLDETKLASLAAGVVDDADRTVYSHIRRLPAATCMLIDRQACKRWVYWSDPPANSTLQVDDSEAADTLRLLFTEAVRCRLDTDAPTAIALSGGLDSSSIACVAGALTGPDSRSFITLSAVFPGLPAPDLALIDERPFIAAVVDQLRCPALQVVCSGMGPIDHLGAMIDRLDGGFIGYNLYMHWQLWSAAANAGARVFLDGLDGDTVIGHGYELLGELAASSDWTAVCQQIDALATRAMVSRRLCVRTHVLPEIVRAALRGRLRCAAAGLNSMRALGLGRRSLVIDAIMQRRRAYLPRTPHPSVRLSSGSPDRPGHNRWRSYDARGPYATTNSAPPRGTARWQAYRNPTYQYALELMDHSAAAFGMECRFPFLDTRLMEFCLAIPAKLRLRDGWTRYVMRIAMDGILPPMVQWRPGKQDLQPNFRLGMARFNSAAVKAEVQQPVDILAGWASEMDMKELCAAFERDPQSVSSNSLHVLYRYVVLNRWLRLNRAA